MGGNVPFGNFPGGSLIGGSFPDTVKNHYCNIAMTSFIITILSKLVLEVLYCSPYNPCSMRFDIQHVPRMLSLQLTVFFL